MAVFLGVFGIACMLWSLFGFTDKGREAHWRYETSDLTVRGVRVEKGDGWEDKIALNAVVSLMLGFGLILLAFTV